jgi:tRNA A-37 threonylcarbamoyl transferase component Bud32
MSTSYCPHCRVALEPDARFCGSCGGRIEPPRPAARVEASSPAATAKPSARLEASSPAAAKPSARKQSIADLPTLIGASAPKAAVAAPAAAPPSSAGPSSSRVPTPSPASVRVPTPSPPSMRVPTPAPLVAPSSSAATAPPAEDSGSARKGARRPPLESLIGRTLNGRYLVERKIGEGGFGAVFRGKQVATGREVALKVLHPHNVSDATVVARFRREAEACSKLTNPHSVTIYDFDETEDGILYLAMELLKGKPLQEVQRDEGTLAPQRVLRILDQVAEALAEAHGQGIVHRDMKPENVMIDARNGEDFVKVLDFGIAKIVEQPGNKATPALTAVGQTLGTLEFMSPEQLRGRALDGRSDIYALGMMAFEMLTGELPFKAARSSTEVIQFHLQTVAPAPSSIKPELKIPPEVDQVVLKMVAKARDDRHVDAEDLRKHIHEALATRDKTATKNEALRVLLVVGGLALLVAAIFILVKR